MSANKQTPRSPEFVHSNFFALRTPLLPNDELAAWGEGLGAAQASETKGDSNGLDTAWRLDVQTLRDRLRQIVARPEILHALYVASPSLQAGIEHWKRDPDSKKGIQAERALVRYFARMAARSTPFGLFSGCSVGRVDEHGDATRLVLKPRAQYRLCSRLDFDYLFALTAALRRDRALEMELSYWPNSSLHKVADAWYYTESRLSEDKRTHHLVRIESDVYLEVVLARAQNGASIHQLVEAVLGAEGDANPTEEEANEYVLGLIRENEIVLPSLSPLLTGKPPLDEVIDQLESASAGVAAAKTLRDVRSRLSSLERGGLDCTPADYDAITAELEKLPAKIDRARLYQVDMIKPVEEAVLGEAVIAELTKGVEILCRIGQSSEPEEVKAFREAFIARYERAMVPLMDALDEELGIGFGSAAGKSDASPLLRGLRLRGGGEVDFKSRQMGVHPSLVKQVIECARAGKTELELDTSELEKNEKSPPNLANAFCLMGSLVAASPEALQQGKFEFYLHGGFGPSGARLLGRFCHEDPQIESAVRHHLRQEETRDPEAVYAEVVYLPEGRIGNVLCRPVLREYEIPYLGRSGAAPDRQLPVSDLMVGMQGDSIVLYSRRLGRRIIPRVTNAHGFMNPQLSSVYRFLCYLQHQHGASVPGFSWGALEVMDFLPRVRVGRIVLSPARWRLSEKEVEALGKDEGSKRFAAVQKLRRQRNLPRWVVLQEGDNSLPVDLNNALTVDAFVHVLKRASEASLMEMYPPSEQTCVSSAEGRFHHELNVPFVRKLDVPTKSSDASDQKRAHYPEIEVGRDVRILPPGSDWLYVKLYGGSGALDDILTTATLPLVRNANASGSFSRWFFIRYADPQDHLRIRFNGTPNRLREELLPAIYEAFNPLLTSGKVWKIELDTYQREIERYGGIEGLLVAEDIFWADSEAALDILQELAGDEGLDIRWRTGMMGVDRLLRDFGLHEEAKRDAVSKWRDRFQAEFKTDMAGKKQLADKFRTERRKLESLLEDSPEGSTQWRFARQAFDRRSARNLGAFKKLRTLAEMGKLTVEIPELLSSYSHMHVNRLIRAAQVAHEFVFYDFLFQLYEGRLARKSRAKHLASVGIARDGEQ